MDDDIIERASPRLELDLSNRILQKNIFGK